MPLYPKSLFRLVAVSVAVSMLPTVATPALAQAHNASLPADAPPASAAKVSAAPASRPKTDTDGPQNPLLVPDQNGESPGSPIFYDWDGKPQSEAQATGLGTGVSGDPAAKKPLSFFIYDFFEPARRIIEAHRAAMSSPTEPIIPPQGNKLRKRQAGATISDDETGNTASESAMPAPNSPQPANDSANAFQDVADPLTQLSRNVSASIPPDYALAPGDALTIRDWSATRAAHEFSATLDPQGAILLEGGRRVVLRGATTAQAERLLRQQLAHLYRGVQVTVALKELRTISVTVSGEAFAPGSYTVPSVATAFNVLYAAGGPTESGSLRQIEVRRHGLLVGKLDVYKFIMVGEEAGDVPLRSGDILYIPPRFSQVTVDGEVRHPAIFELRDHETLRDALRYAGGVKPSGVAQRLQISTLTPGAARVLKDVDLSAPKAGTLPLYDGDAVEVFSVRQTLMNRVTVEGAVDQPGDYALAPGMRVADLLSRARGPLGEAYLTRADLYRWNPDNTTTLIPIAVDKALAGDPAANLPLARWDRLKVFSRDEVAWTGRRQVMVRGAVQRPGVYPCSTDMRVRDLLLLTGGPRPDAYLDRAVLLHRHGDGTYAYDFIRLADALKGDPTQDLPIGDSDVLAVYKIGEAQFTPEKMVAIKGEVTAPGLYPRGDGMHLSDLLKVAGGLRPGADAKVVVAHAPRTAGQTTPTLIATRVTVDGSGYCSTDNDPELADGDVVTVRGTGGFKDHVQVITLKGAVNHPGPIVLDRAGMRLSDAVRAAGGLSAEAFPQGVQFARDPALLGTAGQHSMALVISRLNDVLNQSAYQREQAKSDLERMKAVNQASQPAQTPAAPLAALSGGGSPLAALAAGSQTDAAAPTPGANIVSAQLAGRDLVSAPRVLGPDDLVSDGNVAVNLTEALRHPGGGEDLPLVDGDTITIPERPTTVQVIGAVMTARAVMFQPGLKIDTYVANAGGYTPDAARDRIVVIHLGGGLITADKAGPLQPGDVIVVPTKVMAEKLSSGHSGGGNLFQSLGSSALSLGLLKLLL